MSFLKMEVNLNGAECAMKAKTHYEQHACYSVPLVSNVTHRDADAPNILCIRLQCVRSGTSQSSMIVSGLMTNDDA